MAFNRSRRVPAKRKRKRVTKRNYRTKAANLVQPVVRTNLVFLTEALGVSNYTSHGEAYSLSLMPSYSNMSALYDQYRIVQVKEQFMPQASPDNIGNSSAIPLFYHAVDHDDNVPYGSYQRALNEPRCIIKPFHNQRTVTFRPRLDADMGNISSSGIIDKKQWLDTDSPTAAHYGLKWGLIGDVTFNYSIIRRTTYTVEFRHPKSV